MVPAAVVESTLGELVPLLAKGDIVIDGGNSYYHERHSPRESPRPPRHPLRRRRDERRRLGARPRLLLDDRRRRRTVVQRLDPIFADARARRRRSAAARRAARARRAPPSNGYLHCGPVGAGHFVKMVHNGIEYGLMAAYAEGLNILCYADIGKHPHERRRRDHAAAQSGVLSVRL